MPETTKKRQVRGARNSVKRAVCDRMTRTRHETAGVDRAPNVPRDLSTLIRLGGLLLPGAFLGCAFFRRAIPLLEGVGFRHELAFFGLAVPTIAFSMEDLALWVYP